jgi:hypothetical protein
MYDLLDILSEVESTKENPLYANMLCYFDSPVGVSSIVDKLANHIQNRWAEKGRKYKVTHTVTYPPFHFFVQFIGKMCSLHNDPSFIKDIPVQKNDALRNHPARINTNKGEVKEVVKMCLIHQYASHTLEKCREFPKPIEER